MFGVIVGGHRAILQRTAHSDSRPHSAPPARKVHAAWERSPCRRENIAQRPSPGAGGGGARARKKKEAAKMPMIAMPEDWERAVVVAAHPDDIEYGIASAVARWTGQGKQVTYLLATRGEAGIAGMHPDQVGPLRVEEELRARRWSASPRSSSSTIGRAGGIRDTAAARPGGGVPQGAAARGDHHDELRPDLGRRGPGESLRPSRGRAGPCWTPWPGCGQRVGSPRPAACDSIRDAYVGGTGNPTHFVDVTATIDAGVASLRQHQAYIDGLAATSIPTSSSRTSRATSALGARLASTRRPSTATRMG